jgi:alkane 1-monooxygenase
VGAIMAINVGHELIHKNPIIEQWTGGLLFACVTYGGFKVEHVRGHHVNVSTPDDASSARYGQSLYKFLPHAYLHNFLNAWELESDKLKRKGKGLLSFSNELIWWYSISFIFAAICGALWGWAGVAYFFAQSFIAFSLLEVINYIEHYGLHRRKSDNGRYERTNVEHSWNSNFLLTNLFLFQLQRHSDHHAYPKRRYQILRHHDVSPQLPSGHATMVVLALLPPLWFKIMNPKVKAYYKGEEHQLD